MKTSTLLLYTSGIVCIGLIALASVLYTQFPKLSFASVQIANEYHATTTSTGRFPADTALTTSQGVLGSVIITGAAAGVINIYDATTSNISLRAPSMSSTSILVATFPASAAAGTYTFDQVIYNGLFVNITGTMPTTTITYR